MVTLPPLRERKEDLLRLVRTLLARLDRGDAELSVAFMVALVHHDWPFNVRELFGVLRRAVALGRARPAPRRTRPKVVARPSPTPTPCAPR